MVRFGVGMFVMLAIALTDIRLFLKYAYLFYAGSLILLIAVEVAGTIGMGAQRWIDLKVFHLQPSELMKIALVLSLARYFHRLSLDDVARPTYLVFPILLVAAPVALVMRQPDLGTSFYCSWAASPCSSSPGCASGNLSGRSHRSFGDPRCMVHAACLSEKQDHDLPLARE